MNKKILLVYPNTTNFGVMPTDYTLKIYGRLIACAAKRYKTYSVAEYINLQQKPSEISNNFAIIRHDVDLAISNAVNIARIDNIHGVKSTFYFRCKNGKFPENVIRRVAEFGHEIGYHYEVMSDAKGDAAKARILFENNLQALRRISSVSTACMHGRSFSPHHNLNFWKYFKLQDFGLSGEPYLSIDCSDIYYFSDSGARWDNSKFRLRDIVASNMLQSVGSTEALIRFIDTEHPSKIYFLTHTDVWFDSIPHWLFYQTINNAALTFKTIKKLCNRGV